MAGSNAGSPGSATPAPAQGTLIPDASAQAAPVVAPAQAATDVNPPGDEYSPSPDLMPAPSTGTQADPNQPAPHEGAPPAGALNDDNAPAAAADGQQTPGPVPYGRFKEVNDKVGTLSAEREQLQRGIEFYQNQYNELVAQVQGVAPATGDPARPAAQPGTAPANAPGQTPAPLPQGIKGPGEWEDQTEMAAYFDHAVSAKAQPLVRQELAQAYQQAIAPQIQSINKWVGALEEMVVKAQHPDFDDVVGSVMSEMFVTDHEGKIWNDPAGNPKVKNQALLNYIRQSPMPRMALYNYGVSKRAPQKIADTVTSTTEQLLKAINTRPKGPTVPRQAGGGAKPVELDWDTPKDQVDQYFKEHGIA